MEKIQSSHLNQAAEHGELLQQYGTGSEIRNQPTENQLSELEFDYSSRPRLMNSQANKRKKWSIIILGITFLIVLLSLLFYATHPDTDPTLLQESNKLPFKKVLWLYTQNELQAESMYEVVYRYHHNHTFTTNGYQVHLVNSLTAYDYISDNQTINRITYTMQHSKIDEAVHNLLKLSLLIQHGGVIINTHDTVFPTSDLSWIEGVFASETAKLKRFTPQVFLYNLENEPLKYSAAFMAARPNASLIHKTFQALLQLISTGKHTFAGELGILARNKDTQVDYIRNGLADVLNLVIYQHQQESKNKATSRLGLKIHSLKNHIHFNSIEQSLQTPILMRESFTKIIKTANNNQPADIIFNFTQSKLNDFLDTFIINLTIRNPQPLPPKTLINHLLSCPGNKEVFVDILPQREIELCLIVMENLSKDEIEKMRRAYDNQTYSRWKLVIPSEEKITESPSKAIVNGKVTIMEGRSTKVHNIQQAATKHCHPKGYAVLLNYGENFNHKAALQEIAKKVKPRDTVGSFIGVEQNGTLVVPQAMKFNRKFQGILNPNITKMELIVNHLRIFSIECFRYIPQFDLRTRYGIYFSDRIIFLMTFLEMIFYEYVSPPLHYITKKYAEVYNIPHRVQALDNTTFLKVIKKQKIDLDQLKLTRARIESENMVETVENLINWKIPFTKMLAFNPGNDFVSVKDRKGPQIIPKLIHQVWLGGQLPPAKKYFYEKTKKLYPDYEIKLWRNENITRENFPMIHDVMQNLIEFNKRSPYSKLATVTDILRHQLLYHYGGFWKDAGVNLFRRSFEQFRTYKIAISVDKTFRHRWLQGMCFFGNVPKLQNIYRITNFKNTNRMRIYRKWALGIAGPIDFRNYIIGDQEYNPQFLQIPYEGIYPAQIGMNPMKDQCMRTKEEIGDQPYQVEENGCYLLPNCSQIYPLSIGVEHNCYGGSWTKRRDIMPPTLL